MRFDFNFCKFNSLLSIETPTLLSIGTLLFSMQRLKYFFDFRRLIKPFANMIKGFSTNELLQNLPICRHARGRKQ